MAGTTDMADKSSVGKNVYLHQVQFASTGCQMVEEAVKSILMYVREINTLAPSEFLSVSKSDDELDETPLGPLINYFHQVFPAAIITEMLRSLRPQRNHCAHRAFVFCFLCDVSADVSLSDELARIKLTIELAWSIFGLLSIELKKLSARLEKLRP